MRVCTSWVGKQKGRRKMGLVLKLKIQYQAKEKNEAKLFIAESFLLRDLRHKQFIVDDFFTKLKFVEENDELYIKANVTTEELCNKECDNFIGCGAYSFEGKKKRCYLGHIGYNEKGNYLDRKSWSYINAMKEDLNDLNRYRSVLDEECSDAKTEDICLKFGNGKCMWTGKGWQLIKLAANKCIDEMYLRNDFFNCRKYDTKKNCPEEIDCELRYMKDFNTGYEKKATCVRFPDESCPGLKEEPSSSVPRTQHETQCLLEADYCSWKDSTCLSDRYEEMSAGICAEGYSSITDYIKCQEAVNILRLTKRSVGFPFQDDPNYPKGCYYDVVEKMAFLNVRKKVNKNLFPHSICEKNVKKTQKCSELKNLNFCYESSSACKWSWGQKKCVLQCDKIEDLKNCLGHCEQENKKCIYKCKAIEAKNECEKMKCKWDEQRNEKYMFKEKREKQTEEDYLQIIKKFSEIPLTKKDWDDTILNKKKTDTEFYKFYDISSKGYKFEIFRKASKCYRYSDQDIDGGFGEEKISECSSSCGGGVQKFSQSCNSPRPSGDGVFCDFSSHDLDDQKCAQFPCKRSYEDFLWFVNNPLQIGEDTRMNIIPACNGQKKERDLLYYTVYTSNAANINRDNRDNKKKIFR